MPNKLCKYPFLSQFLLILLFGAKFADSNVEFVEACKQMTQRIQTKSANAVPQQINTKIYYPGQPIVAAQQEFAQFAFEKIGFLALELDEFVKKYKLTVDKDYFFTLDAVSAFVRPIKAAEEAICVKLKNNKKDVDYAAFLATILHNRPSKFFEKIIWNFNENAENKFEREERNGAIYVKFSINYPPIAEYEGGAKHSTRDILVSEEFLKLRRCINAFIKELKMEIVYGQEIAAFNEIKTDYPQFKKIFKNDFELMEKEAENFVEKNWENQNIADLIKKVEKKEKERLKIKMESEKQKMENGKKKKSKKKKLEEKEKLKKEKLKNERWQKEIEGKFVEIDENNKNLPREYGHLNLYNLLNNATNELGNYLESIVSKTVDGYDATQTTLDNSEKFKKIWALAELIVKPKLRLALEEALAMIPSNSNTSQFVAALIRNNKINPNEIGASSRKGKKGEEKFKYPLVEMVQKELALPSIYLNLEGLIVNNLFALANHNVHRRNIPNGEHSQAVRESHIRFAAVKVLLAYERLKEMYFGKNDLAGEELENALEYADQAMDTFLMASLEEQNFGGLIEKFLLKKLKK